MRFEVPFNAAVYTAKSELWFKLNYAKVLKRAKLSPIFAGACFLIAWLDATNGHLDFGGYFAVSFGILLVYVDPAMLL